MKKIVLDQGMEAIVDDQDFDYINQWKWIAFKNRYHYYAVRRIYQKGNKSKRILMHRVILDNPRHIDHINRNGLDNRRSNLRPVECGQNQMNQVKTRTHTSIYKGVCWLSRTSKWRSSIGFKNKSYHIGYYKSELDAAKAYDKKAAELFGEFACLNFS